MRYILPILASLPLAAQAELFQIASAPQSVLVYPGAARVTRAIDQTLPAGRHQLRLSDLPAGLAPASVDIRISGASLVARAYRDNPTLTKDLLAGSDALQDARATLQAAEEALARFEDQIDALEAEKDAAEAQIAFLQDLDGAADTLDAAQLRALGQAISEDGASARKTILSADQRIRALEPDRKALVDAIALAQSRLTEIDRPIDRLSELELDITVPTAGPVALRIEYFVKANWTPQYRLYFDVSEGTLSIDRDVAIQQYSSENWRDVALEVTTLPLGEQSGPSTLWPRRYWIQDGINPSKRLGSASVQDYSAEVAPARPEAVTEAPVIVDQTTAVAQYSGAGVVYGFETPVSVVAGDLATVALSPLDFQASATARAVPLRDATAFRILSLTNDSAERILPGQGIAYVDNEIVGRIDLAAIEPGEETELPFGPLHGLQLTRAVLDKQEGDRGIIARENRQQEAVRITVENLTDRTWDLTLVDQIPYSEQEDLEIDWQAAPQPTRENVEDQRGILEWDIDLAPGTTREIRLETDIRWPDGQVLQQ